MIIYLVCIVASVGILLNNILGVSCVEITNLHVPKVVLNGSSEPIVLDCKYNVTPEDAHGLVVRWFLNDQMSYQWIPTKKPQGLGVLKGRLDLSYSASGDEYQRHRALRILRPTTQLSGQYKCLVTSFANEDQMTALMLVYAPEKRLELVQRIVAPNSVNITCIAERVFPEPRMILYLTPDSHQRNAVEGASVHITKKNGSFNIVLSKIWGSEELEGGTEFECMLVIPQTDYVVRKSMTYYPGYSSAFEDELNGCKHSSKGSLLFIFLSIGLVVFPIFGGICSTPTCFV